jgi:hypothetical protein
MIAMLHITPEEAAFGFAVRPIRGGHAVTAGLYEGLFAVKVICDDGALGYCICDHSLSPIYPMAFSLAELRSRFRYGHETG